MKNKFHWDESDLITTRAVEKANPYHDEKGKFTSPEKAVQGTGSNSKKVTLGHPKGYGATTTIEKVSEGVYEYSYGFPMHKQEFTVDINGYPIVTEPLDAPKGVSVDVPDKYIAEIPRYQGTDLTEMASLVVNEQWSQWEGNFSIRTIASNMMGLNVFSAGSEGMSDTAIEGIQGLDSSSAHARHFVPAAHSILAGIAKSKKTNFEVFRAMVVREGSGIASLFKGEEITMPPSGFTPSSNLLSDFRLGGTYEADFQGESVYNETPVEIVFALKKGARGVRSKTYADLGFVEGKQYDVEGRLDLPIELVTGGKFKVVEVEQYTPRGQSNRSEKESMGLKYTIKQIEFFNPETGKYEKN